jgi:predicted phage terminase large subunit-like protein
LINKRWDEFELNESKKKATLKSPAEFASVASGGRWVCTKHLDLINENLMRLYRRDIMRLIINIPPRHGKSEIISKYFPVWYMGADNNARIIHSTYSQRFAMHWGRQMRRLINDSGDLLGLKIDKSSRSGDEIRFEESSGEIICLGAGGSLTGRGADLIIIDDPIKNFAQASSEKMRENIWDWFNSTLYTRLEPEGIIVIIMTRWHEDDLCGRIMTNSEGGDNWELIKLPAIAVERDRLGRDAGEAFWPERFNAEAIDRIRRQIGSFWFSGLYQQEPNPAGGAVFRRQHFRYFDENEGFYHLLKTGDNFSIIEHKSLMIFAVFDLAVKQGEMNDYTVALVFGWAANGEILILDVLRRRFEPTEHIRLVNSVYQRWRPVLIGIESVQYQTLLVKLAARIGIPVKELKAKENKVSRSLPMAAYMEQGIVFFRRGADWLAEFESELLNFPNGRHDDQTDAFAYIAQMISPEGQKKGILSSYLTSPDVTKKYY